MIFQFVPIMMKTPCLKDTSKRMEIFALSMQMKLTIINRQNVKRFPHAVYLVQY